MVHDSVRRAKKMYLSVNHWSLSLKIATIRLNMKVSLLTRSSPLRWACQIWKPKTALNWCKIKSSGETNSLEVAKIIYKMEPIIYHLQSNELPQDELKAHKIYKHATKYTLMLWRLYKIGRTSYMIRFREEHEITLVLAEEHQGAYGSHIGGLALVHKLIRVG